MVPVVDALFLGEGAGSNSSTVACYPVRSRIDSYSIKVGSSSTFAPFNIDSLQFGVFPVSFFHDSKIKLMVKM